MKMIKSVFHIDEQLKWKTLLRNLSNIADAIDISSCAIEVVINSEAVTQLRSRL
jgi:intracellular sulfur oxidation DsrE/DsrF family protein